MKKLFAMILMFTILLPVLAEEEKLTCTFEEGSVVVYAFDQKGNTFREIALQSINFSDVQISESMIYALGKWDENGTKHSREIEIYRGDASIKNTADLYFTQL